MMRFWTNHVSISDHVIIMVSFALKLTRKSPTERCVSTHRHKNMSAWDTTCRTRRAGDVSIIRVPLLSSAGEHMYHVNKRTKHPHNPETPHSCHLLAVLQPPELIVVLFHKNGFPSNNNVNACSKCCIWVKVEKSYVHLCCKWWQSYSLKKIWQLQDVEYDCWHIVLHTTKNLWIYLYF